MHRLPKRLTLALAALMLGGGCAAAGPSPLNFGVRRITGSDSDSAFAAAQAGLLDLGYRISRADPMARVIEAYPASEPTGDDAFLRARAISSPRRFRRLVTLRVVDTPQSLSVFCKVAVQEQVTEQYQFFRQDLSSSDLPAETPINRGAATTPEQNIVWQTLRRDKTAERRILEAILDRTDPKPG